MNPRPIDQTSGKLSTTTKVLYGIGQLTDSISANIFIFFFVFFLTDIAGVNPAIAGLVSLIAMVWDGITDPIIGYCSDNIKWKSGRRRPLVLMAAVPIGIALWLMFTTVEFQGTAKSIYYIAVAMFFYTSYTCYYIPYMALGAEMTDDYDERTSVRFHCLAFQLLGVFAASSGTMIVVEKLTAITGSVQTAWSVTAAFFGLLSSTAALIAWNYTRGKEPVIKRRDNTLFLPTLMEVVKIKSIRTLAASVLIYAMGFSITMGILVFLMNNNMQLNGNQQVVFWTFLSAMGLAIVPICNGLGVKMGKRKAYIQLITLVGVAQFLFTFIDFSFALLMVFGAIVAFGHNTYFGLFQAMMYDCCEAYEYKTGLRREGAITSIIFLFQKIGFALGMWMMGVVMDLTGYIGGVPQQTEGALGGIKMLTTVYAPACYILSACLMITYKLDGKAFDSLKSALKKNNRETGDFMDIF